MDLTESEDIKRRWQENTELYRKGLHDLDKYDDGITHLEPDILEYKEDCIKEIFTTQIITNVWSFPHT